MGVFDSFKKKKPEERSRDMKPETPPRRQVAAPGRWQVGDRIMNRYEIHDIKKGGMGIVYIALDLEWNQMFAIKTFQDQFLWNEDAIDRFMNEAEIWVNLERHTNIVFANFVWTIAGKPYIFLEYIEGGDLSHYIGKLDTPHAIDFAIQFCNGMDYAYKQLEVIHRDIKPQNAMVTREGVLKVTDFGLVKAVVQRTLGVEPERGDVAVSRGMGTWPYMPPEQFPEEIQKRFGFPLREVTTRSDIYSFGVTFYHVLTGNLPFQTIEQIFTQKPINPAALNSNIPKQLDLLLMKCLEKDTHDRYGSFEQLVKELTGIYNILPEEEKVLGNRYQVKGKKEPLIAIDWSSKGVSLAELGKYQEAIVCHNRALDLNPRKPELWNNKGLALRYLGRYQEAIVCYDKALEINQRIIETWNNKAYALWCLGKYQEAIACYDRALDINPRDAETWFNKGVLLARLGRHREAIACLKRFVEMAPSYSPSYVTMAKELISRLEQRM